MPKFPSTKPAPLPPHDEEGEGHTREETLDMLRDWISVALKRVDAKLKKNEEFPPLVLRNASPEQEGDGVVCELDFDEIEKAGGMLPVAEKIMFYAERDANALGGRQTYFVTIDRAPGRCPIVVGEDSDENEDDELDEEGEEEASFSHYGERRGAGGFGLKPPVDGWVEFLKLRLDHERFLVHENRTERTEMFRQLNRVIQSQAETIQNYDKENARARGAIEEIMDRKHIRDLELRQLQKQEEYKDKALGLLEPFGAAMATKMFGPRAVPPEASPILRLFSKVFDTFTQEQVVAFMETGTISFTPAQRQNMLELFGTIQNLREQEAASKAQMNGGSSHAAHMSPGHGQDDGSAQAAHEEKGTRQ